MSANDLKYMFEKERHDSFKKWPFPDSASCNIKKMAEAGFFWCGNSKEIDSATCYYCLKVLDGWEVDDDPWKEHRRHAPQCIFVKNGKPEGEYTVEEFLSLMSQQITFSMDKYKKMSSKMKIQFEEFREQKLKEN